jgi:hypothetical protein
MTGWELKVRLQIPGTNTPTSCSLHEHQKKGLTNGPFSKLLILKDAEVGPLQSSTAHNQVRIEELPGLWAKSTATVEGKIVDTA